MRKSKEKEEPSARGLTYKFPRGDSPRLIERYNSRLRYHTRWIATSRSKKKRRQPFLPRTTNPMRELYTLWLEPRDERTQAITDTCMCQRTDARYARYRGRIPRLPLAVRKVTVRTDPSRLSRRLCRAKSTLTANTGMGWSAKHVDSPNECSDKRIWYKYTDSL